MPPPAEDSTLAAARTGDPEALDALLRQYQPRIYRFGMRMCRDEEDAKDVLQETLLAAARSLASFRGGSSLSTWLYSIARGFCIKKRRRSKFAPAKEVPLDTPALAVPDPGKPLDEALASRQIERAVEAAIRSLPPAYREVLLLRDVEGLTAPEVALVLGLGLPAVKSRLHRARATVRERLQPLLEGPSETAGPACPDVAGKLSRYLEGEIDREACADLESHVASCPRCRRACDALRQTLGVCRALPEPAVPAEVQESVRSGIRRLLAART
ncbi:MAG TPA: sigma-70 family RNA polymerase sigma factor [Thermoanaerobaculia bacterium]|nr:sigma-70 family RNA polymerase sigma factor [Thermoanaerobaculia bacterium]